MTGSVTRDRFFHKPGFALIYRGIMTWNKGIYDTGISGIWNAGVRDLSRTCRIPGIRSCDPEKYFLKKFLGNPEIKFSGKKTRAELAKELFYIIYSSPHRTVERSGPR